MHCCYCNKSVFGNNGMTVPGVGAAHVPCFQADQLLKRTFQSLEINALNEHELQELHELVIAEQNSRNRIGEEDDIELF